jgi:HD-like signal output (HDOD) protein
MSAAIMQKQVDVVTGGKASGVPDDGTIAAPPAILTEVPTIVRPTGPAAPVMDRDGLKDVVRKISTIATLPEVVAKIVSIVEDPKSSAAQLHRIVSHDPALVTRILKVVNSAFYGLPGQIGSIERAIVLLGLNAVKNIAVAASLGQLFRGVKLCEGYTARDLWTHCIAVAVTSRELARSMKLPVADEAFLAGMIHDVGMLISMQLQPEKLRQTCEMAAKNHVDFCEIERHLIGTDHQQLGQALCELWKFPRTCQLVAGNHHAIQPAGQEGRQVVALVYVADTIACGTPNAGFPLTARSQALDAELLSSLQIEPGVVERARQRLPELLNAASVLI